MKRWLKCWPILAGWRSLADKLGREYRCTHTHTHIHTHTRTYSAHLLINSLTQETDGHVESVMGPGECDHRLILAE